MQRLYIEEKSNRIFISNKERYVSGFNRLYLIDYNISRWANILVKGVIKKMEKILFTTNSQKILEFLIQNPGEEYLSREIQIAVKISKAGTNFALNDYRRQKL